MLAIIVASVRGPHRLGNGREIARSLGKHRMADVDMIAIHVRRAVKAVVDDAVVQPDLVAADLCLDAADQVEVLADHRRLLADALAPYRAFIARSVEGRGGKVGVRTGQ